MFNVFLADQELGLLRRYAIWRLMATHGSRRLFVHFFTIFGGHSFLRLLFLGWWTRQSCLKLKVLRFEKASHGVHMFCLDVVVIHAGSSGHLSFHVSTCCLQTRFLHLSDGCSSVFTIGWFGWGNPRCKRVYTRRICWWWELSPIKCALILHLVAMCLGVTRLEALV